MAWQGIPFRFPLETSDFISIALNHIPKILMESTTDYKGLWLTAGAALAGGIIPACIAGFTFWQNTRFVKAERALQQAFLEAEREKQQDFLRTEREDQQSFLVDERKAQLESLAEDRDAQLTIAKSNFNMQVLSVNRQAWINSFRNLIAEYCVLTTKNLVLNGDYKDKQQAFNEISAVAESEDSTDDNMKTYEGCVADLKLAMQKFEDVGHEIDHLKYKIEMMLNPTENDTKYIIESMCRLRNIIAKYGIGNEIYEDSYRMLYDEIKTLTTCTQTLLKKEWDRVKEGR